MIIRSFLKTTIFYGAATAINKGLMLIALPFLGVVLSIEEYGLWALSQIIISLGAPIVSLNSSSGILREGVEDSKIGYCSFKKYSKLIALISLAFIVPLFFFPRTWLWYTVVLILIESFQSTLLGWYRARDKHINYFSLVSLKLVALVGATLIIWSKPSIESLMLYQTVLGGMFIIPFYFNEIFNSKFSTVSIDFKKILIFSTLLIPHGIAQWVISGSDRLVIKHLLNDIELGKYSLAYSLAMVLMIVNSGLALTIPNFILKNYEGWLLENKRLKILFMYSLCAICINFFIILSVDFFSDYIELLNKVDLQVKELIIWLSSGMYLLGIYFFYVNILFYHKKSKTISTITGTVALINFVGTYIFVSKIGIFGAAITTFVTYLIYVSLFINRACVEDNRMYHRLGGELIIIFVALIVNFSAFFFI